MAIEYISNSTYTGSASNPTFNKPTWTSEWDIMIWNIFLYVWAQYTTPSWWTKIWQQDWWTGIRWYLYYKIAWASEPASYTITWWWNYTKWTILTYRWLDITAPINTSSNTTYATSNTILRAAAMNVTTNDCCIVFLWWYFNFWNYTITKPSAITTRTERINSNASFWTSIACDIIWGSNWDTGNVDATLSVAWSNTKIAFMVAITPLSTTLFTPQITQF